ncbi:MAG: hypothetical protein V4490_03245, partial [Pseudomonadota bacterium]
FLDDYNTRIKGGIPSATGMPRYTSAYQSSAWFTSHQYPEIENEAERAQAIQRLEIELLEPARVLKAQRMQNDGTPRLAP